MPAARGGGCSQKEFRLQFGRSWELQFPWCFMPYQRALPPCDGAVHAGICSLLHGFAHPTWKVGQ